MHALLVSTYDLGRPPFGLASPAAWLEREGWRVRCLDLAVEPFDEAAVAGADLVGIHLPMHAATRLAGPVLSRLREHNPRAPIAAYGLYAPLNAAWLQGLGVERVIGGEYEEALAAFAREVRSRLATKKAREAPERNLGTFDGLTVETFDRLTVESFDRLTVESFDRLSFLPPARHLLPPLDRYAHLHLPDGSVRPAGAIARRH